MEAIHIACLHDQNKSGFLEGRVFSNQSELFQYFLNSSDWLDKSRPSKKGMPTVVGTAFDRTLGFKTENLIKY